MQTLCYYHSKDKEQANNETLYYFYLHNYIDIACKGLFTWRQGDPIRRVTLASGSENSERLHEVG